MQNSITTTRKAVMTLAAQIKKANNLSLSAALSWAWYIVKEELSECMIVQFMKKSGEVTKRVVTRNFAKFNPVKGNGRKAPQGLNLFADAAKIASNLITGKKKSSVVSCYEFETI
jgi:type II secretory pathway component PulL